MNTSTYVAGIDLGTTNCSMCVFTRGYYELIKDESGSYVIPSVVAFRNEGLRYGSSAKNDCSYGPVACETKCFMGLHSLPENYDTNDLTYSISADSGKLQLVFDSEDLDTGNHDPEYIMATYPECVAALVLRYLVGLAKQKGFDVSQAVITVPATYSLNRIHAVIKAAHLAGLCVLRIVQEPCAAAFAYYHEHANEAPFKRSLLYDLGGGTFDLTIIDRNESGVSISKSAGNSTVGGRNLDKKFALWINKTFHKDYPIGGACNSLWKLRQEAEDIKIQLSSLNEVSHDVSDIYGNTHSVSIKRENFEEACKEDLDNTVKECKSFVGDSGIDSILLVGGSSQIPYIERSLKKEFGDLIKKINDPGGIVAKGAAMIGNSEIDDQSSLYHVSLEYTYLYNIYMSCTSNNDNNPIKIFQSRSCITTWKKTYHASELNLSSPYRIYIYTEEKEKSKEDDSQRICIGYFQLPEENKFEQYVFSFGNDYEMRLQLIGQNGMVIGDYLNITYYYDIDKDYEEETVLINRFMDLLTSIKESIVTQPSSKKDTVIRYCDLYLSFEKFYRLCREKKDVEVIQREYDTYKRLYTPFLTA